MEFFLNSSPKWFVPRYWSSYVSRNTQVKSGTGMDSRGKDLLKSKVSRETLQFELVDPRLPKND